MITHEQALLGIVVLVLVILPTIYYCLFWQPKKPKK
jgi:hypothetical protein